MATTKEFHNYMLECLQRAGLLILKADGILVKADARCGQSLSL